MKSNDSTCLEAELRIHIDDVISVLDISNSIEELSGYCPNDFLSSKVSLTDRIHADDQDIAENMFASKPTNSKQTVNLRLRQVNGRIRCIKATYQKCISDDGNGIVLELLLQDARSLERTLEEATAMVNFRAIMENTNDYIYFKDRNHVYTGASQTLVDLCDPAEHWRDLLGQTDYDMFPEEYADIYYRLEKQVFSGIPIAHEVQEYVSKHGKKGWVDNRKYPIIDDQGEIIGLYGIARDITDRIMAEQALKVSEQHFRNLFNSLPDPAWIIDNNHFVECNQAAVDFLGYPNKSSLLNTHPSTLSPEYQPDGESSYSKAERMIAIARDKEINRFEWVHKRADGRNFCAEVTLSTIRLDVEPVIYCVWHDISERKQAEEELQQANIIVKRSPVVLFRWKAAEGWPVEFVSSNVSQFGYTVNELLSGDVAYSSIVHPDDLLRVVQEVIDCSEKGLEHFEQEYRIVSPDGDIYWIDDRTTVERDACGHVKYYQGIVLNITERKRAEEQIQFMAHHDPLTGLANRRELSNDFKSELKRAIRFDREMALFYLDLNRFKNVNDELGHEVGDALLQHISERMSLLIRETEKIYRVGGDEFCILIPEFNGKKQLKALAERIIVGVSKIDQFGGMRINIGCSIGIAIFPEDGKTLAELTLEADNAMYHAKTLQGNYYSFVS